MEYTKHDFKQDEEVISSPFLKHAVRRLALTMTQSIVHKFSIVCTLVYSAVCSYVIYMVENQ